MNTQDQQRLLVLNRILAGHLSVAESAPILDVTERQMWRILAAYRKEGAAAVVHGNRGRTPSHRISDEVRQQVIALAQGPYRGCNQQHLRDLLEEREGITLSRASVHRHLQEAHLLAEPSSGPPASTAARTGGAGRDAGADRRQPPCLARGARILAQPAGGCLSWAGRCGGLLSAGAPAGANRRASADTLP